MYKELKEKIESNNVIIIHRHTSPDGDAFGSQFGLRQLIKDNWPEKEVYAVGGDFTPDFLKELFPVADEIDESKYQNALVIVVDTANTERIQGEHYALGADLVKIDHHPNNEPYGSLVIVEEESASAAEMIERFAHEQGLKVTPEAAKLIYTGMVTDTGRFMYQAVNSKTFESASRLIELFDTQEIYSELYKKTEKFIKFGAYVQSKYKLEDGVAYMILPKGVEKRFGLEYKQISSSVFLIRQAYEAKYAMFASYDPENKKYRVSLRSKDKDVNQIATQHNGGGHAKAAGASATSKKELKEIIRKLKQLNNE